MARSSRPARGGRAWVGALVLTSLAVVTVDARGGDDSPLEPAREAVGDLLAPVQEGAAVVARPLREVPGFFQANRELRGDILRLEAENATLRGQVAATSEVRYRAAELDGLLTASRRDRLSVVPARVVSVGPAQSFNHTVTIDAGTTSGIRADLTVLNNEGLVGRVVRAGRHWATVLLIVDRESVVGARLGSDAEVGVLSGRGTLDGDGRLDLDLVDDTETPGRDDVVLTFGSQGGAPYVAGIPIGTVEAVFSSPRETAKHAVINPFVDFSSLDLVGVVVPAGTTGDRPLINAGETTTEDR